MGLTAILKAVTRRLDGWVASVPGIWWTARCSVTPGRFPAETFRGVGDRGWLWLHTTGRRFFRSVEDALPALPPERIQLKFTGAVGKRSLTEAARFHSLVGDLAGRHGVPLREARVLDFGCGWGRITRFFTREVDPGRLVGVDPDPEAIELCHRTNPWARFCLIEPLPPTELPDASFDLIYGFSVFSHLSEDVHLAWLEEFHRLLAPSGIAILTTRSRSFFAKCASVRANPAGSLKPGARRVVFRETERWQHAYDSGEFCHDSAAGQPEGYGETCIPRSYVDSGWARWFELVEYIDRGHSQNVIVVRKRSDEHASTGSGAPSAEDLRGVGADQEVRWV